MDLHIYLYYITDKITFFVEIALNYINTIIKYLALISQRVFCFLCTSLILNDATTQLQAFFFN